jgi:CDP-diacylglycerol--glycerol-3-phosphate 3-phosphatidyltransferase
MKPVSFYVVNSITGYRILAAPVLIILVLTNHQDIFKWLLGVSFLTDMADGILARKLRVTSLFGSKMDSIGDDLTIIAALVGAFVFKHEFFAGYLGIILVMLGLFVVQIVLALIKYKRATNFHTYMAKLAAWYQGCFLVLLFLLPHPVIWIFYLAAISTIIDLVEEIIIVFVLPEWETNVKGLYWVLKKKKMKR